MYVLTVKQLVFFIYKYSLLFPLFNFCWINVVLAIKPILIIRTFKYGLSWASSHLRKVLRKETIIPFSANNPEYCKQSFVLKMTRISFSSGSILWISQWPKCLNSRLSVSIFSFTLSSRIFSIDENSMSSGTIMLPLIKIKILSFSENKKKRLISYIGQLSYIKLNIMSYVNELFMSLRGNTLIIRCRGNDCGYSNFEFSSWKRIFFVLINRSFENEPHLSDFLIALSFIVWKIK